MVTGPRFDVACMNMDTGATVHRFGLTRTDLVVWVRGHRLHLGDTIRQAQATAVQVADRIGAGQAWPAVYDSELLSYRCIP